LRVVRARHFIAAPVGEVFDWLADGRNAPLVEPGFLMLMRTAARALG
jgi:hypothetical protein